MRVKANYGQQVLCYLVAIIFSIMVWPHYLAMFRPYFLVILLYFWACRAVKMLPLFWLWCLGLVMDLASGTLLGQHALVLVIISYALAEVQPRLRLYGFWQHGLLMLLFASFYVLLQAWFMVNISHTVVSFSYYGGVIGTMLVWCGLYFVLQLKPFQQLI